MKSIIYFIPGVHPSGRPYAGMIKGVLLSAFILAGIQATLLAQEFQYTKPNVWFGAAAGANFSFYRGSTQQLNYGFTAPVAFHQGNGAGLYVGTLLEVYHPGSVVGGMLHVGYDNRQGSFNQEITPCNCPADLKTNLSYITLEPSLRIAPFKSGFYLFGGPRMAFNLNKSFRYKIGINPALPEQAPTPDVTGDISDVHKTLLSMQVGAGYDIPLSSPNSPTQAMLSPFVSFQPYFGQEPRSTETWNITALRVGAALKFGVGHRISTPESSPLLPSPVAVVDRAIRFTVHSPKNIPVERRVRETFPLRNYVFFDLGSTEIPDRYVLLRKNQVKDFKEDQLEVFTPKNLSGRSSRGMVVYYNVLNILGDRMGENPAANIKLVGSSEKGPEDAQAMAESIKRYLTSTFGIADSRITIEGRDKPKILSAQLGGTRDLELLKESDRRVSIESSAPAMLMEFQSGPDAPLKPVEITEVQTAPLDSYVTFQVEGAQEALSSWSLEIKDENGQIQNFGPYTQEKVSMPGKSILGTRSKGDFKVRMVGQARNGKTITKETSVNMVLWTPDENEQGMRFSVIYEFDESKAINIYEKYLTNIVTPKIPKGAMVIIHGYTDIIGDVVYNQKLSLARANDVKQILTNSLSKLGRSDVKFEVYGFGEDEILAPFDNKFPEERSYNRTVLIDIFPQQ